MLGLSQRADGVSTGTGPGSPSTMGWDGVTLEFGHLEPLSWVSITVEDTGRSLGLGIYSTGTAV